MRKNEEKYAKGKKYADPALVTVEVDDRKTDMGGTKKDLELG
jgi:hypothetical protein